MRSNVQQLKGLIGKQADYYPKERLATSDNCGKIEAGNESLAAVLLYTLSPVEHPALHEFRKPIANRSADDSPSLTEPPAFDVVRCDRGTA